MNSTQVKDKIKNVVKKTNLDFNLILRNYMYERFIERLAFSKYKNNFILKGGYYLSIYFGLDSRSTMDIDLSIKNETLTKENISKIMNEIINIQVNDNVEIQINEIVNIRTEDKYGGYRINITVKLDNMRETFNVDVATGDPITPREAFIRYQTLFNYKYINLKTYNLETVLAEKLESILSKGDLSSRLKDYYDIYLIYHMAKEILDMNILRKAVNNTFSKRNFAVDTFEMLKTIKESKILMVRWNAYSRKKPYAANIAYEDVIDSLSKIIDMIEVVLV